MPSLVDLPKDIRAMIFEDVLHGHRTPPIYPSKLKMVDFPDMHYKANIEALRPYHEQRDTHSPSNSLPLLLTSRQVSVETQSVLSRTRKTTYVLDISVLNDLDLFSTWISVPRPTTRLSTLHVDIRLFGHIITTKEARDQIGCGGRYGFHWSFYAVLERFLRYGPVGAKKGRKSNYGNPSYENRHISVENLILDFHSAETELPYPPGDVEYSAWVNKHHGSVWDTDGEVDQALAYKTRPEWLLRFLKEWLRYITDMSYHAAMYGACIYEKIGAISMLVDGQLWNTTDLADQLARLHFDRPADTMGHLTSETRLAEFWKWKKATLLKREALGFPVVWPQDVERV
ncbi:hypothetical protein N7463_009403 [Penicillium fimorum]|uniref:Uncharacterized protein n=1 Tax=Penicillium fimorum TaxID=1882269 RepID=A0A9W9XQQ8_9EURO|nr:hypothetical protein N7463_009403 [Penicillium fimorum]